METSPTIGLLTEALAKAQLAFLPIKKTEKVDFQTTGGRKKYNYAPLAEVIEATRKGLSDNGLAIIQRTKIVDGNVILETILSHTSNERVVSEMFVGKQDQPPQSEGSGLSYKRRYSTSAILNVASEEDDDGEAVSTEQTPRPQPPKPTREIEPAKAETHSEEQQDHTTPLNIEEMRQLASLVNKRWAGLPKKERAEAYAEWVGRKFGRHEGAMTPEERAIVIEALEFEIAESESSEEPIDHE